MSFRFWLQARLGPGAAMNVSKSTTSLSRGPRSAKYTISPRGDRATASLPGTGLFFMVHDHKRAGRGGAATFPRLTPSKQTCSCSVIEGEVGARRGEPAPKRRRLRERILRCEQRRVKALN